MPNTVARRITHDVVHAGTIHVCDRDDQGRPVPTVVQAPAGATFGEAIEPAPVAPRDLSFGLPPRVGGFAGALPPAPLRPAPVTEPAPAALPESPIVADAAAAPTLQPDGGAVALGVADATAAAATGDATLTGAGGGAAAVDYADMRRDDLLELAQARGLSVEGTGAGGNIVKQDLVDALKASDAAAQAPAATPGA